MTAPTKRTIAGSSLRSLWRWPAACIFLSTLAIHPSHAGGVEPPFPEVVLVGDTNITPVGSADYRWLGFVSIVSVAYFAPSGCHQLDFRENFPKALLFRYHRSVTVAQLATTSRNALLDRHSEDALAEFESDIMRLNEAYQPVDSGDEYLLSYDPKRGLKLDLNGQTLTAFACDSRFAVLYLSIWLQKGRRWKQQTLQLLGMDGS